MSDYGFVDLNGGKQAKEDREMNLRFKITWCENNLGYLAGQPDSEHKTECIRINREGIAEAKAGLHEMGIVY